jgi:hypothetical protein
MSDTTATQAGHADEALSKGAVEEERPTKGEGGAANEGGPSLAGQLGHRDQNDLLKGNDTDFPEPDADAEHTGG